MGLLKLAFPQERVISLQQALDSHFFGPVYHGTTLEASKIINEEGFKAFEGEAGKGPIRHGFEGAREYALGLPPPIHFLGFGIYATTSQAVGKKFNGSSLKGLKVYYLDVPRMETINFNAPNTMMKWWLKSGYAPDVAKVDRVAATKLLTDSLRSRFDAVYHKGGGWHTIDIGPQIVVFDPSRIYMIDPSLAKPGDIGRQGRAQGRRHEGNPHGRPLHTPGNRQAVPRRGDQVLAG